MNLIKEIFVSGVMMASVMAFSFSGFGQDIPVGKVPAKVASGFKGSFPKAMGQDWEMKGDLYEVEFKTGMRKEHKAWFDNSGVLVKLESELSKRELPAKVLAAIDRDYMGFRVDDVKKITEGKSVRYSVELKSKVEEWKVVFDSVGMVVDKKRD